MPVLEPGGGVIQGCRSGKPLETLGDGWRIVAIEGAARGWILLSGSGGSAACFLSHMSAQPDDCLHIDSFLKKRTGFGPHFCRDESTITALSMRSSMSVEQSSPASLSPKQAIACSMFLRFSSRGRNPGPIRF